MGVAAQDNRLLVALAQAQDFEIVVTGLRLVPIGIERTVVDLEQHAVLLGRQYQRLEKQVGRTVARVTDDVDVAIAYRPQHRLGILVDSTRQVAQRVQSGDAQVEKTEIVLLQIEMPLVVDDIDFGTQQQLHPVHVARHHRQIAEIDVGTGPGDTARVFGNTQQLQPLVSRSLHHLLQGAECVPAGYRVRVYIKKNIHIDPFPIWVQR